MRERFLLCIGKFLQAPRLPPTDNALSSTYDFSMFNPRRVQSQPSGQAVLRSRSAPFWATASISDTADTSPIELSALGAHVDRCNGSRGRMFELRCLVDAVHGFIAPRFVTTLLVVGFVFGVVSLIV